jgi:hypothetical protein
MQQTTKKNTMIFKARFAVFLFVYLLSVILLKSVAVEAATWYEFPDFKIMGELIGGEYVYTMENLGGVPSYLNSSNNGSYGAGASYYQCTEYVSRYLHFRYCTDYIMEITS